MDKLRCFRNSSKRLSDEKARTDTTLLLPSTVSSSLNFPVRGRGGNLELWKMATTRCYERCPLRARPRTGGPGRKTWRRTPREVHCGIVSCRPVMAGKGQVGERTWLCLGKHKIPPKCKVMLWTFFFRVQFLGSVSLWWANVYKAVFWATLWVCLLEQFYWLSQQVEKVALYFRSFISVTSWLWSESPSGAEGPMGASLGRPVWKSSLEIRFCILIAECHGQRTNYYI